MLISLIGVLLSVVFSLLGMLFVLISIADLGERWARNLFMCGIVQLVIVSAYCLA